MRHLASALILIIANNSDANVVDAQITNNGQRSAEAKNRAEVVVWQIAPPSTEAKRSAQDSGCKFTDKLSNLEASSLNCRAATSPTNVMEAVSPLLTSSSNTHNETKALSMNGQEGHSYAHAITIIRPANGEVIRSNSGALNVNIHVYVDPPLNERIESLERRIFLDGKLVASGIGSTFQLQAVDRGAHSLKATLHHGQKQIQQSPLFTFTLLRHSSIRR